MTGIIVMITIFFLIAYIFKPNKDRINTYVMIIASIMIATITLAIIINSLPVFFVPKWSIIILLAAASTLFYKIQHLKDKVGKIEAEQMTFWGVNSKEILEKNKDFFVQKDGRIEIKEQQDEYLYEIKDGEKKLLPLIFSDIRAFRNFTIVNDLKYFDKDASKLYKTVYKKLQEINKRIEKNIDFNEKLKENHNIAEFFLLDLWEELATIEIIGTGTLNALAETENDYKLIGAMDSAINMNVRADGIDLFAHYLNSKGRLKRGSR